MSTTKLPDLNKYKPITNSQVEEFGRNGHILIPGVLPPDVVTLYRDAIRKAASKYNTEKRKLEERDTYGKAFLQIMNLWEVDENVKKFSLARRFAKIAADLLGVEKVRIYHDQALYKEPGGGPTPWHQDQYYWPLDTKKTVTMWMPLVDISEEMGMLTFASASQSDGVAEEVGISDESETLLENYVTAKGFEVTRPKSMKAGDATWHNGWTLHCAPGNDAKDITREVITVIYYADGARVIKPTNQFQEHDHQRWLCGLEPGSLAASKLNPLIL